MKKSLLTITCFVSCLPVFSQYGMESETAYIVAEGKALYRSEMASWYGTDVFLEKFSDRRERIKGYFSYSSGDTAKCVFFSKGDDPRVIGTISFDSTYNPKTAIADGTERTLTEFEFNLYTIREKALKEINSDTALFKFYKKTSLNLIPLIRNGERKVYVLTGPQQEGVVIFGNDYLLTFNSSNELVGKKAIHKNIIITEYGEGRTSEKKDIGGIHNHDRSTGDFITSTDICTLMLYEKFAGWEQYIVISDKFICIWNCTTDDLLTITKKAWNRINKDQKKKRKKENR